MEKTTISKLKKSFEDYSQEIEGIEFWFARDLQTLLGYNKWQNFINIIEKAKEACKNLEVNIFDRFTDVSKTMELGFNAKYIGLI